MQIGSESGYIILYKQLNCNQLQSLDSKTMLFKAVAPNPMPINNGSEIVESSLQQWNSKLQCGNRIQAGLVLA